MSTTIIRPIAIRRLPNHWYNRDQGSSPVFEFYERPDGHRHPGEEEEDGGSEEDSEESDEDEDEDMHEDEDDEDEHMDDGQEKQKRTKSKDKGKGKAVDEQGRAASTKSHNQPSKRDNGRDLNSKQPIIVLRTGEGWDWSADALTTDYVRKTYDCSGSYSSSLRTASSFPSSLGGSSMSYSTRQNYDHARAPEDIVQSTDIHVGEDDWL